MHSVVRNLTLAVFAVSVSAADAGAQETTFTAFSLRTAREQTSRSDENGAIESLAEITRPIGFVLDRARGDCVLVGARDPARPRLHFDDVLVALRVAFSGEPQAPGVSIEPSGELRSGGSQRVLFFAGIEDTHFGRVCFDCDYLMKRIGLGLQSVHAPGFSSYFDELATDATRPRSESALVTTRFWFYPIVARAVVAGDGVFLDRCQVVLLAELVDVRRGESRAGDSERLFRETSDRFAASFSRRLPELAAEFPVLAELQGLTELTALARGVSRLNGASVLAAAPDGWTPVRVTSPDEVGVLERSDSKGGLRMLGGVTLQSLAVRLKGGDTSAFTELVLATRPSERALSWSFGLKDTWDIVLHSLPGAEDASAAGEYFARGDYLYRTSQIDRAIACWRRAQVLAPLVAEIPFRIGLAFERKGLLEAAAPYFSRALELDPSTPRHPLH